MNLARLPREEREKLYAKKMTELQRRWGNPVDEDWEELKDWPDDALNRGLQDTISQLRFEKFWSGFSTVFDWMIKSIIFLGIAGLLLFGIRQLFG